MTIYTFSFYFMPIFGFAILITVLVLQLRMFGRYRHRSFFLLSAATLCQLTYILGLYGVSYHEVPFSWPLVATILQVAALTLGLWGTVSLFRSYADLAAARRMTSNT